MNENRKKTRFYVGYFLKLCNRYIDNVGIHYTPFSVFVYV